MNIEVGKSYQYVVSQALRPHPNEVIEDGTIVTVTEVLRGAVMLDGYNYPHKVERLRELPEVKKSILEHTMQRLVKEGHSVEDIQDAVQSLAEEAKKTKPFTIDEMFEE